MVSRVGPRAVAVVLVLSLAGCGMPFGGGGQPATETTVTPAPVPDGGVETERPGTGDERNVTAMAQPRYLELRPTCTRPPGLVIHIQVMALANDDPATHEGVNTTWQFAARSNRAVTGPYENFVGIVTENYRPLLNTTAVRYGPLEREGDRATRRVTVFDREGTATRYRWTVERQTTPPDEGCWKTTGVAAAG